MTHQKISFIKSFIRIVGFGLVIVGYVGNPIIFIAGGLLLIVAECLGVLEELTES